MYFQYHLQPLDFSSPASLSTINNWVSGQTNGKISSIISELSNDDKIVPVNATNVKGTFSGTLVSNAGPLLVITNGKFDINIR